MDGCGMLVFLNYAGPHKACQSVAVNAQHAAEVCLHLHGHGTTQDPSTGD